MWHRLLFLLLAAAAAWPACGSTPDDAQVARDVARLLEQAYPADGPGAAVLVARGDQVLFRGARGRRDIARATLLSVDDAFPIASLTKQFVAASVLRLAGQGRIGLDDPVAKFLPGFPDGERILIRQLLNHTGGLTEYTVLPEVHAAPMHAPTTTAALLAAFRGRPLDFAPGERHAYSNSGYVLLGAIIEAVTGQPWSRHVEEALLAPLGLASTGWGEDPGLAARRPTSYLRDAGAYVPAAVYALSWAQASGGLVSTVDDLHRWTRALHGGRVLDASGYQRMVTPEGPAANGDGGYGYGLERSALLGHPRIGHGGWVPGYLSSLVYLPDEELTVVVLENSDSRGPLGDAPVVARRLAAIALGKPFPVPVPVIVDAAELRGYAGVYRAGDTESVVRVLDDALTLQKRGGTRWTLQPAGGDRFLRPESLHAVQFERDADGGIAGLRITSESNDVPLMRRVPELPPPAPVSARLPRAALERVAGDYRGGGQTFRIRLEGGILRGGMVGQPAFEMVAESAGRFGMPAVNAAFEFDQGMPAPALLLTQHGSRFRFVRLP